MYKIGELSKLCRLPVKTLRFYDGEGLLVPDEIDRFTGYRYYSAARLADCSRIIALKELGFSLDEIKRHIKTSESDEILALINEKRAELETQAEQIKLRLKRLDSISQNITGGEKIMFDVIVSNTEVFKIAFVRKIFKSKVDAYSELSRIKRLVLKNVAGKRFIIINNETEYKASDLDLCVGVEITGSLPYGLGLMTASPLPSECARLICKASELENAYRVVIERMNLLEYQITGAFFEIYYGDNDDSTVELSVPVCRMVKCDEESAALPPFENDAAVVGKWKLIDIVPSREQFMYGFPKTSQINNIVFNELYFLAEGEGYWIVEGWTKGILYLSAEFPERHTVVNRYELQTIDGHDILFVENNRINPDGMQSEIPELWVYEKISGESFKSADIKIRDNTDYPFISDDSLLGKWLVRDFCSNDIDSFDLSRQNRNPDKLYLRSIEFTPDGKCVYVTQKNSFAASWTKGLVLNQRSETASAYKIATFEEKEYLILEWKSGDYSFSGKINWYVFTRA